MPFLLGVEGGHGLLAAVDQVLCCDWIEPRRWIIVGSVSSALEPREGVGIGHDRGGKSLPRRHAFNTGGSRQAVLDRPVDLIIGASQRFILDKKIAAALRQVMEDGVVCGAHGSSEIGLARRSNKQFPRRIQQLAHTYQPIIFCPSANSILRSGIRCSPIS